MRTVHVVAWESEGTGGFNWYHEVAAANAAYEVEKLNADKYKGTGWKAFRFDFTTDLDESLITRTIETNLDALCFAAPLAYMPGYEREKVKVMLHHHGRPEFLNLETIPDWAADVEWIDDRENDDLVIDYKGVRIYYAEECDVEHITSDTRMSHYVGCYHELEDAFDVRNLSWGDALGVISEQYEELFPDSQHQQILAYYIDQGWLTQEGLNGPGED